MECKKFKPAVSAYIDRQLSETEADAYRAHLSICADCRAHLAETKQVSLMLRTVEQPDVPRELHSYIMTQVTRQKAGEIGLAERVFEWLLKLNPRPVGYAAGLVVSSILFVVLFSVARPIPVNAIIPTEEVAILPIISGSDQEFHTYNNLPPDVGPTDSEHYYQLPRVLDNSALVSFSHIAYQKPGNEGMAALVEVGPDGSAKLVDVLNAPKDPYLVEQLWWSLRNRTFQPAIVSGHPVSTRIVLFVEKVDVSG